MLLFLLRRRREANKKRLANVTVSQIVNLRMCLLRWVAHWMDKYILECYCLLHDVNAPPSAKGGAGHRYKVHPEAIWESMEASSRCHTIRAPLVVHCIVPPLWGPGGRVDKARCHEVGGDVFVKGH